ncbi:hypothetical protein Tco_0030935 [Tanacetum coccineum]
MKSASSKQKRSGRSEMMKSSSSSSSEQTRRMVAEISLLRLTHIPPNYGKPREMNLKEKKEFYSLPLDVQLYERQQYNLLLGEPDLTTKPEDGDLWFSNKPCQLVPNVEKRKMKKHGGEFEDNVFGPTTNDDKKGMGRVVVNWRRRRRRKKRNKNEDAHLDEEESGKKKTADDQEY